MLFMLTALYRLRDAEERLRRGEARSGPPRARMLKGKTVGIIGYGHIAKALISRLAGWDARILVSNRSTLPSPPGVAQCDPDTLIAASDIALRSEARRVGEEWVRTCGARWSPSH